MTQRYPHDCPARFEARVREGLRSRRWLHLHAALIGACTFLACWGLSSALLHAGVASLPMRHAGALVGAYGVYLVLLWVWSRHLIRRDDPWDAADGLDVLDAWSPGKDPVTAAPVFRSGGGGDFGGGGAAGVWAGNAAPPGAQGVFERSGEGASGTMEALGGADEGAVVAIPLAVVVGIAALFAAAFGFVVVGLFGIEILVGVAVEIAFASAGGALALKARREGWMRHAIRRTAGPMAAVLVASVLAGTAVARWLPEARTLPDAFRLLSAERGTGAVAKTRV